MGRGRPFSKTASKVSISVWVDPGLKMALEQAARAQNRANSTYVETLLMQHLHKTRNQDREVVAA
jgi:hypothetical protein